MAYDDELKKRLRQVNARITTVERIYGVDSSIYKRIVSTIQKAGGNKRFSAKMFSGDLRSLSKAERALSTVENSKYLTKEGRKQIGERARETFYQSHANFSDTTISKMFDVFQNSSFIGRIFDMFASEVFVDAIMDALEDDADEKELVENLDYFATHMEDFGGDIDSAFERFLDMI